MKRLCLLMLLLRFYTAVPAQTNTLRIIYLIHGDGNYLFHDDQGQALDAAERILAQSFFVGENILNGEVLIFYQKPSENFLLFFPKDDGEFYYYKNGSRILNETYSGKNSPAFEPEADLIKKYSNPSARYSENVLLYYGHEIPSNDTTGYYLSEPEKKFGMNIFAGFISRIINSFPPEKNKFSMIVLSTCRNGNLSTAEGLSPFTDYLVASPADIHLSYLNSESLIKLSMKQNLNEKKFAEDFAIEAFDKMSRLTSTNVSVSVYDLKKMSGVISKSPEEWVTNFYRPPKFGRKRSGKQ